jgi:hypothetical protein
VELDTELVDYFDPELLKVFYGPLPSVLVVEE